MDSFTITDEQGTFAFDGTQGVYTAPDGTTQTFTVSNATDTVDPVVSGTVTTQSGVVYNGTFTAA